MPPLFVFVRLGFDFCNFLSYQKNSAITKRLSAFSSAVHISFHRRGDSSLSGEIFIMLPGSECTGASRCNSQQKTYSFLQVCQSNMTMLQEVISKSLQTLTLKLLNEFFCRELKLCWSALWRTSSVISRVYRFDVGTKPQNASYAFILFFTVRLIDILKCSRSR